jgi:hypothetical protein
MSGWLRLARLAALMPAASPPITTNFILYSFNESADSPALKKGAFKAQISFYGSST